MCHIRRGSVGRIDITAMKARLISGVTTRNPSHGDNPASAARRTLIETAIHRNGSVQRYSAHESQGGAGCKRTSRLVNSGLRKSHGASTVEVNYQNRADST